MATTYDGTPTLDEILAGATLVVTARLIDVAARHEVEEGRLILTYRAVISEVLGGEPAGKEILVRMVGKEQSLASEAEVVLFLTEDHGQGQGNQYVPYFLPPTALDKGEVTIGDEKSIGLDQLRERIATVAARRERSRKELSRHEEGQDLDADYPEVAEMGIGRGDTVTEAQLSAPRNHDDEGGAK